MPPEVAAAQDFHLRAEETPEVTAFSIVETPFLPQCGNEGRLYKTAVVAECALRLLRAKDSGTHARSGGSSYAQLGGAASFFSERTLMGLVGHRLADNL